MMKENLRQKMLNIYVRHKMTLCSVPFWVVFGLILSSYSIYWVVACLFVIFGYIVEGEGVKRGISQGLYAGYCEGIKDEKKRQEDEKKKETE